MNNELTRVASKLQVETSKESIKPVDLEALKLIGVSSINLDVNKEPVKAIDLFLFAYGSIRPDESVEAARDSVRFFLKANRTLEFEGFGKVEPTTLLEAIQDWSRNYEQDSKFKPSITTFFRKKLFKTALYNLRARKIAEVKNREPSLAERIRARRAAREAEIENLAEEIESEPSLAEQVRVMRAARGESKDFSVF